MKKFALKFLTLVAVAFALNSHAVLIYNNSVNDNSNRLSSVDNMWFGDEIILSTNYSDRFMVHFDFQYWATNTSGLTIDVQLRYNDGTPFNGYPTPGTLIYAFTNFSIPNTLRSTINFDIADLDAYDLIANGGTLLTGDVLTLAVNFHFNGGGGTAGIDLYGPPVEGSSYLDYWQFNGSNWELTTNNVFNTVNFGMRVEAVPEPTSISLFLVGGMLLLGFRRMVSKKHA